MATAYANWEFVLSDLAGNKIGEVIDATERTLTRALSGPATAGFKILTTNSLLSYLLAAGSGLNLLIYRNNILQFHGPIISTQWATEDPTATPQLLCVAADPAWRFERRVSGQSGTGHQFTSATDRLTIAETLISTANNSGLGTGQTGVKTLGLTCGSTSTYVAGPYKKLSECIADMSNTLDGFDWYINPIQRISDGVNASPVGFIGLFQGAAVLGSQRDGAVFEYEGRGNMRQPNFIRGLDTLINNAISIPDDGPTSDLGVRAKGDTDSILAYGLSEEIVDTSGVVNNSLRDAILDDHIKYRKDPRMVINFQPDVNDFTGRVPEWQTDFFLGDTVRARILYNGAVLVDGFVRVYKMQFDIDLNNRETLTPTLVQEAS